MIEKVRSAVIFRSSWAKTMMSCTIASPVGIDVSNFSRRLMTLTLCSAKSAHRSTKSFRRCLPQWVAPS